MAKRNIIKLTDEGSGKSIRASVIEERRSGKFMKVWQDNGWERRISGLQGTSLRILWRLVITAGWGNEVEGPGEMAKKIEQKQSNMSRAYKELIEAGFLHKKDGGYCLDPYFCWKGNDEQYDEACRRISAGKMKEIVA